MDRKERQAMFEQLAKERAEKAAKLPKAQSAKESALMSWTPGARKSNRN